MTNTRELAEIVGNIERALAEFGRAARADLEAGGFIMCEKKKTAEELKQEVKELERELEIARLEKQVRELKEKIDRQKGCVPYCPRLWPSPPPAPWRPWNPYYVEGEWPPAISYTWDNVTTSRA